MLNSSDGGQTSLDWICYPKIENNITKKTPILFLVPGMTGDRNCKYMKSLLELSRIKNMKCVVVNHRGCGNTRLLSRN